jgi:phosphoenolpyruvate carboxykinase (ATP)
MKIESDDRNRSLEALGLGNLGSIHWNLPSPALYEEAIRRCEGTLSHLGRSWFAPAITPDDCQKTSSLCVSRPARKRFGGARSIARLNSQSLKCSNTVSVLIFRAKDIFIDSCYAGADERYRVPVRVICKQAWHALFARNMFIR